MNLDLHSSLLKRRKFGGLRRDPRLLGALAVVVLLSLLVFWRPIQRQCLTYLLLRSDAPSTEILSDLATQTRNRQSLLMRLWLTQRISHRHFVLTYLGRTLHCDSNVFHALEPVVLRATSDADIETRELAFAALLRAKHSQLRELALAQLDDVDPAARVLGLQTLRRIATSNDAPIAVRLLSDSEPRVVVAAALILRHVTGEDFAIRSSHALPQFTGMGTNAPAPPDLNAISNGVQRWRDWWKEHEGEYPAAHLPSRIQSQAAGLTTRGFTLQDLNGKPVRLSDYRGKAVLLAFWSLDAPASLDAAPTLAALQREHAGGLVVLGVCVPPAPSCADGHEHKSEQAHHHHEEATSPSINAAQMLHRIHDIALERKITYSMLLDSKGTAGLGFDVESLPVYVLLDGQGIVRRRFPGDRSGQVFEAMIGELRNTNTEHSVKP